LKLGVITDGINTDLEYALKVMKETDMKYAELQFVWDKEIGELTDEEYAKVKSLVDAYGVQVSCITSHTFTGQSVMNTEINDMTYKKHIQKLKNSIKIAKMLGTKYVRVMAFTKIPAIWGYHGADKWNAGGNLSWGKFVKFYEEPVKIAEDEGVELVIENCINGMVTSGYHCRKLIEDLGTKHMKVLWDVPNGLFYNDIPFPDAYEEIKDYLVEVHIKDLKVDIAKGIIDFSPLGQGGLAPYLGDLANAFRRDKFDGVISLESVYRPDGGTFEDGYRQNISEFKKIFGDL
jgi:sugar phosphate isomerase/epimerase